MSEKRVKLTQTQEELYKKILDSYKSIIGNLNDIIDNNMTMRLERMAIENGIDLVNEKWAFNHKTLEFYMEDEPSPDGTFSEETTSFDSEGQAHKSVVVGVPCINAGSEVKDA